MGTFLNERRTGENSWWHFLKTRELVYFPVSSFPSFFSWKKYKSALVDYCRHRLNVLLWKQQAHSRVVGSFCRKRKEYVEMVNAEGLGETLNTSYSAGWR